MRVLLDTNVLISSFLGSGTWTRVLEYCRARHTLVTSPVVVREFAEKLSRKFKLDDEDVADALAVTLHQMRSIEATVGAPFCRDPDDALVLAAAIAGRCDVLITGDADLLVLGDVQGVRIRSPRAFLDAEQAGNDEESI